MHDPPPPCPQVATTGAETIQCLEGREAHQTLCTAVAFSRCGQYLAGGFGNGFLYVHDLALGARVTKTRTHPGAIRSLAFTHCAGHVLAATDDAVLHVYRRDGALERSLRGHAAPLTAVAVSRDGRFAATSGQDARVAVWDLETLRCHRAWGPPYHCEWSTRLVEQHFGTRDDERIARWQRYGERKKLKLSQVPPCRVIARGSVCVRTAGE